MKLQELDKIQQKVKEKIVDEVDEPIKPKAEKKRPRVGPVITYRRKNTAIDESIVEEEKNLRQFTKSRWD